MPTDLPRPGELPARFWALVIDDPDATGCRWWIGAISDDGYGRWRHPGSGRVTAAHRAVWEAAHGPVPDGLKLLHSCNETNCVQLAHLAADTQTANQQQMARQGRAGGPHHRGRADTRGAAGRARAIRDALRHGYDPEALAAARSAGDPYRHQLTLFPADPT